MSRIAETSPNPRRFVQVRRHKIGRISSRFFAACWHAQSSLPYALTLSRNRVQVTEAVPGCSTARFYRKHHQPFFSHQRKVADGGGLREMSWKPFSRGADRLPPLRVRDSNTTLWPLRTVPKA